jgi:hypothetical protein
MWNHLLPFLHVSRKDVQKILVTPSLYKISTETKKKNNLPMAKFLDIASENSKKLVSAKLSRQYHKCQGKEKLGGGGIIPD